MLLEFGIELEPAGFPVHDWVSSALGNTFHSVMEVPTTNTELEVIGYLCFFQSSFYQMPK